MKRAQHKLRGGHLERVPTSRVFNNIDSNNKYKKPLAFNFLREYISTKVTDLGVGLLFFQRKKS